MGNYIIEKRLDQMVQKRTRLLQMKKSERNGELAETNDIINRLKRWLAELAQKRQPVDLEITRTFQRSLPSHHGLMDKNGIIEGTLKPFENIDQYSEHHASDALCYALGIASEKSELGTKELHEGMMTRLTKDIDKTALQSYIGRKEYYKKMRQQFDENPLFANGPVSTDWRTEFTDAVSKKHNEPSERLSDSKIEMNHAVKTCHAIMVDGGLWRLKVKTDDSGSSQNFAKKVTEEIKSRHNEPFCRKPIPIQDNYSPSLKEDIDLLLNYMQDKTSVAPEDVKWVLQRQNAVVYNGESEIKMFCKDFLFYGKNRKVIYCNDMLIMLREKDD